MVLFPLGPCCFNSVTNRHIRVKNFSIRLFLIYCIFIAALAKLNDWCENLWLIRAAIRTASRAACFYFEREIFLHFLVFRFDANVASELEFQGRWPGLAVEKTHLSELAPVLVDGDADLVTSTSVILVADNATVCSLLNKVAVFPNIVSVLFQKLAGHDVASKSLCRRRRWVVMPNVRLSSESFHPGIATWWSDCDFKWACDSRCLLDEVAHIIGAGNFSILLPSK